MTIPESQLETWSHQGATVSAQSSHVSIRNALSSYDWPDDVRYDVYLQGSYRNATNIRGDSDVDVVVQLDSVFRPDKSALTFAEMAQYERDYADATYSWTNFRTDVLRVLRDYYGWLRVTDGSKAIKVETNYLKADVIPCMQYRKYRRYRSANDQDYVEGMTFYVPSESRWVVNYPKVHYANGVAKQHDTSQRYKRSVRLFKNARTHLVNRYVITSALAPSYFVECLLYNVASSQFVNSLQDTFINVLTSVANGNLDAFVCQNEQHKLFGSTAEQWSQANAISFLKALIDLWKDWGR